MFFTYRQNNSGGRFIGEINIIIEADSAKEADEIAQENGVYFDGVDDGHDCECCGDRWYRAWEDGTENPEIYGEAVGESHNCKIVRKQA
jgi:hypothetical protein